MPEYIIPYADPVNSTQEHLLKLRNIHGLLPGDMYPYANWSEYVKAGGQTRPVSGNRKCWRSNYWLWTNSTEDGIWYLFIGRNSDGSFRSYDITGPDGLGHSMFHFIGPEVSRFYQAHKSHFKKIPVIELRRVPRAEAERLSLVDGPTDAGTDYPLGYVFEDPVGPFRIENGQPTAMPGLSPLMRSSFPSDTGVMFENNDFSRAPQFFKYQQYPVPVSASPVVTVGGLTVLEFLDTVDRIRSSSMTPADKVAAIRRLALA